MYWAYWPESVVTWGFVGLLCLAMIGAMAVAIAGIASVATRRPSFKAMDQAIAAREAYWAEESANMDEFIERVKAGKPASIRLDALLRPVDDS